MSVVLSLSFETSIGIGTLHQLAAVILDNMAIAHVKQLIETKTPLGMENKIIGIIHEIPT